MALGMHPVGPSGIWEPAQPILPAPHITLRHRLLVTSSADGTIHDALRTLRWSWVAQIATKDVQSSSAPRIAARIGDIVSGSHA